MSVLLSETKGAVRVLTLNRPDKRNALNHALTKALVDALTEAQADEGIRAVVLIGAGKGFCAGADLAEFADLTPDQSEKVAARATLTSTLQSMIATMATPVLAAVHGAAVGGGAGLALSADMLIVADTVKLGFPEVRHDIVPALVMPNLVRHFSRKLGFELISTGRMLDAEALHSRDVANQVVPESELLATALTIAGVWAASDTRAMTAAKQLYYTVCEASPEDGFAQGRDVNKAMRGFRS